MAEVNTLFYDQVIEKCGKEIADRVSFSSDYRNVITLKGKVDIWQQVVDIGHIAGKLPGTKGVLNYLESADYHKEPIDRTEDIQNGREIGVIDSCDVLIIGAGITGSGIARELSKYDQKIIVVEKRSDVCEGASKANNAMIHSGYDSKPGTLKAKLCVRGNALYSKWAEELHFHFIRCGSFIVGFDEEDKKLIEDYYERGKINGCPGIAVLNGDEAREIEPVLSTEVTSALWTPSAGYAETYEVVEALMENAIDNGATLMLDTEVLAMDKEGSKVTQVVTNKGIIRAGCIINASGINADEVAEMAGDRFFTMHGRRGTLIIMDKKKGDKTPHCYVGTAPRNFTKGGGPMKTPEGNPLWGPSAIEVPDKDNLDVDEQDIRFIMEKGKHLTPGIDERDIIRFFSGNRPANYVEDFVIEKSEILDNFIHCEGIQSPAVASAPGIAEYVENIYTGMYPELKKKADYNPIRKAPVIFRECSREEQDALIRENPLYGHIICRCETVTEAEIVNAIHGKVPARTVDAVKRRTRAGMGRCQGGFCGPRVVEILARELGVDEKEITKKGPGSNILDTSSREEAAK